MKTNAKLNIKKFRKGDDKLYQQSLDIRQKVFVVEQKVPENVEIEFEDEVNYYLVFQNEAATGTARWRETEKGIKLERFATLFEYRHTGGGKALLNAMLEDVLNLKRPIYLNAQETAVGFYARYGFVPEGHTFYEAGISHIGMRYAI